MSTETRHRLEIAGHSVEVVRKDIRNLHLGVYPPQGHVRVAVPEHVGDEAVRLAVISRLGWIKRQQAKFQAQPRQSVREYISGESHYFLGRRYRLDVLTQTGPIRVRQRNLRTLELQAPAGTDARQKAKALQAWYRRELKALIPPLITKWAALLGVQPSGWGVKRMKTKWGTCNIEDRRIWLNLELAKKPLACLEYVIVHELTHLLERHHTERFASLLDQHLPAWRMQRDTLNQLPLADEDWSGDRPAD